MEIKQIQGKIAGKLILTALLGVGIVYVAVNMIVNARLETMEVATRLLIADQEATLVAIAEATARSGADAVTESIVRDCTIKERSEFDDLLGRLNNGLTQSELTALERLFGRCGSFYSERKTVMAARLSREIEVYETYVTQLNNLLDDDFKEALNVSRWKNLSAEEQRQSELFSRLVSLQDEIITTLLAGSRTDSPKMQEILQEARETQESLILANKQASTIRAELISL